MQLLVAPPEHNAIRRERGEEKYENFGPGKSKVRALLDVNAKEFIFILAK